MSPPSAIPRAAESSTARVAESNAGKRTAPTMPRISRQPACPVSTNVRRTPTETPVVDASAPCGTTALPTTNKPFYLQRQRFHGFRDVAQLPKRGSLANLDINERILLKKRLLQHRLQEMIHRLQSERPEKITGVLAAKIEYLKELATRP
eukprot:m.138136 g.138136  ORF g.138136 m.138136 type:complete len:150 (+) comp16065_c0_seq4:5631-6080(+)